MILTSVLASDRRDRLIFALTSEPTGGRNDGATREEEEFCELKPDVFVQVSMNEINKERKPRR